MLAELEIVYDPKEDAAGSCTIPGENQRLTPARSWEWFSWLIRKTGNERLDIVFNVDVGRWSLVAWAWTPSESCQPMYVELETFASDPALGYPSDMLPPELLLLRLLPMEQVMENRKRKARDAHEAELRVRGENIEEKKGAIERLKRMGLNKAASDLQYGRSHFAGKAIAAEQNEMWADKLTQMGKD